MPELIVTCRELKYAGKTHLRGARFEASPKDAKLLKAIAKAADAPPSAPVRKVAETRAPAPVVAAAMQAEPDAETPAPRYYRTRRLRPQD
jgi:hypothetical protein